MTDAAQRAKAEAFIALHTSPDILVLANTWDVASSRVIAAAGFPAIATTSAGIAFALGYPDGERMSRAENIDMVRRIAAAVDLPVTADMEAGYGPRPEDVAETVRLAIEAGAVGMNLEDGRENPVAPLLDLGEAVERIGAARETADATGVAAVINARTDGYFLGAADDAAVLADTVRRGNAYLEAGARSIFVPFLAHPQTIATLAREIDGPVNVLGGPNSPPISELQALGVARVSIGGSLARAAYALVRRVGAELAGPGTFGYSRDAIPHHEMDAVMGKDHG